MKSKKPIWSFKAKSVRITKSLSLTVEDARKLVVKNGKLVHAFSSNARQVVKKLLTRKRRHLPDAIFEDIDEHKSIKTE